MADAATAAGAAADHGAGGLPQFYLAQWPGQMVWMLVIFAVLYLLFARVFVPRVGDTISEREDTIGGDIRDARHLRDQAKADAEAAAGEMAKARARAHKIASDARDEAKASAAARQAEEDTKLALTLAAAEARIATARGEAMSHVRAIAVDTAQAMIEKLTGAPAAAAEVEQALVGRA